MVVRGAVQVEFHNKRTCGAVLPCYRNPVTRGCATMHSRERRLCLVLADPLQFVMMLNGQK